MEQMNSTDFPHVLVVSHNVFSRTVNVGRFLADTFRDWPADRLSQLFFYDETPTVRLCERYFRITDQDVLQSLLRFRRGCCGTALTQDDIDPTLENSISAGLKESRLYRFKTRHKSLARVFRDAAWKMGTWKTERLNQWIEENRPDLIYYVMSDYCFPYEVVSYLADRYRLPVFISIEDDYYFNDQSQTALDRLQNRRYKALFQKAMERSFGVSYASDVMKDMYEEFFHKPGIVQYKSAEIAKDEKPSAAHKQFLYAGSLNFGRWKSLLAIGQALLRYDASLVIYSNINSPEINQELAKCPAISFKGFAPIEQIEREIEASDVLLVVESFDEESIGRVKCSLSTKVADYVGKNRCILACGPLCVGSIDYLYRNGAAIVSDYDGLPNAIETIFSDPEKTGQCIENARRLAARNHDAQKITALLLSELKKG